MLLSKTRYIYIYTMRTHTHPHTHIGSSSSSCNPKGILVERGRERERWKGRQKGKEQKIRPIVCVWRGAGPKNAEAKATAPSVASRLLSTTNVCFSSASSHLSCLENERERERERRQVIKKSLHHRDPILITD